MAGVEPTSLRHGQELRRRLAGGIAPLVVVLAAASLLIPGYIRPGSSRVSFLAATTVLLSAVIPLAVIRRLPRRGLSVALLVINAMITLVLFSVADHGGARAGLIMFVLPTTFVGLFLGWNCLLAQAPPLLLGSTLLLWIGGDPPLFLLMHLVLIGLSSLAPAAFLIMLRRRLEEALIRERVAATTDQLTGLTNRRGLAEQAATVLARAREHDLALVAAVADIDHFKQVNDTLGHLAGDEVLRRVATALRHGARAEDLVARLGGEEFVVLAAFDDSTVPRIAERLRATVAAELIDLGITTSVGAAWQHLSAPSTGHTTETARSGAAVDDDTDSIVWKLIDRADDLCYTAKQRGRNRAECSESPVAVTS